MTVLLVFFRKIFPIPFPKILMQLFFCFLPYSFCFVNIFIITKIIFYALKLNIRNPFF